MLITIVSSQSSWINPYLKKFINQLKGFEYTVSWVHTAKDIKKGDVAFFLSFEEIIPEYILSKHVNNIVVHGSDLPMGKGMSPISWQILEGRKEIVMTLFEMEERLDSGGIYLQDVMQFDGTELIDEIRDKQVKSTFKLCLEFLKKYPKILNKVRVQRGKGSFYKRRGARDSRLDISKTIAEQFDLLRVVDNDIYPAFFKYKGQKYFLKVTKG